MVSTDLGQWSVKRREVAPTPFLFDKRFMPLIPVLITTLSDKCEQDFVRSTLPSSGLSIFLAGVYLPPGINSSVYEGHLESVDQTWGINAFNLVLVCDDFNLPDVTWTSRDCGLIYTGSINDKIRMVGDQFSLLHFTQKNQVFNNTGSVLDLIFTNSASIQVFQAADPLVPCDPYHPALTISCPSPSDFPMLDAQHKSHLNSLKERFCTNPKSFWEFVRSKRGASSIPDDVHLGETKATGEQVSSLFASHFSSVYRDPQFTANTLSERCTNQEFSSLP
ncbi:hypothetical protein ACI65C_010379 [Semiaphis heraclei]